MAIPKKDDPEKNCETCGKALTRKRFDSGRLEDRGVFLRRRNCSQACANTKERVTKDALHWRARTHRRASCEDCSDTKGLHVHHKDRNPANNDVANLATLCASCHLKRHWREDREKRMLANPWANPARASGG